MVCGEVLVYVGFNGPLPLRSVVVWAWSVSVVGVVSTSVSPLSAGTGMFGRVMLVHDIPSRCYYALKVMNIAAVIRLKQIEHVISEKNILKCISHPFIVNL